MKPLYEQFTETADTHAARPALRFKKNGAYATITFNELKKAVDRCAHGLINKGVQKGDRVIILSENRPEWVIADLAIVSLGAISVPIHTTLSSAITEHIANHCGAKIAFVSDAQFQKITTAKQNVSSLETVINIDDTTWKTFIETQGGKIERQVVNLDDVASIIYTSGTTAEPKGVMLTHGNFMSNAIGAITAVSVTEEDSLLSFLPLSHVLERTAGYYAPLLVCGASIAYAENVKALKKNLQEIRPTILVCVPRIFEKIHAGLWEQLKKSGLKFKLFTWAMKQRPGTLSHKIADILVFRSVRGAFGGRLRFAISGGATLNHKLARFFQRLGITISEGYGLTETAPIATCNRLENIKFGTVGQQLAGVEVTIAPDKEILIKGPNVMKGYFNNEELTKQCIDEEGWLHTGDLGFLSSEGFLVVIGRKKEMIALSNGKIAWPEQLELALNADRLIAQSFVYGNAKSFLVALVIPEWTEVTRELNGKEYAFNAQTCVTDNAVKQVLIQRINKLNDQFADWEKIRRVAILSQEFSQAKDEVTPTLKLRRHTITEHYRQFIDELYENA